MGAHNTPAAGATPVAANAPTSTPALMLLTVREWQGFHTLQGLRVRVPGGKGGGSYI